MSDVDLTWIERPLNQTEVDGVPVVWRPGPPPLHASLLFRVGTADEAFVTSGITHLVEHLTMRAVGSRPHQVNASVSNALTVFTTSGRPGPVTEFLAAVCRALSDLPVDALATEAGVLEAEGGGGPSGSLLALRLGARGCGLAGFNQPALGAISPAEVRHWVGRWFVRGNAVLALSGPPPEGLRLQLPAGPRRPPSPVTPRAVPGRIWDDDHPGVALGLLADLPDAAAVEAFWSAMRVAGQRAERLLRHERGQAYTVEGTVHMLSGTVGLGCLTADSHRRYAESAIGVLLDTLDAMAGRGPDPDELAADLARSGEALTDPRGVWASAEMFAADLLLGLDPRPEAERLKLIQALTPDDLRDAVAAAAETATLLVPDGVEVVRAGWQRAPLSVAEPVSGPALRRRLRSWAPPRGRLVHAAGVGATLLLDRPGAPLTARWADVVGVGVHEADGFLLVQTGDGGTLRVRARDWRGGQAVLADLRACVASRLFFDAPQED